MSLLYPFGCFCIWRIRIDRKTLANTLGVNFLGAPFYTCLGPPLAGYKIFATVSELRHVILTVFVNGTPSFFMFLFH